MCHLKPPNRETTQECVINSVCSQHLQGMPLCVNNMTTITCLSTKNVSQQRYSFYSGSLIYMYKKSDSHCALWRRHGFWFEAVSYTYLDLCVWGLRNVKESEMLRRSCGLYILWPTTSPCLVFSSYSLFLSVNTLLLSKWHSIRLVILIPIFLIS